MGKMSDEDAIDTWCLHCGEDMQVRFKDALRDPNIVCAACGTTIKLDVFAFNAQRRRFEKLIRGDDMG